MRTTSPGGPRTRRMPLLAIAVALGALLLPGVIHARPSEVASASVLAKTAQLGQVRYIQRGLTVQPPHKHAVQGKLRQKLYSAYGVQTKRQQKASVAFRDGSILQVNQLTSLVLHDPSTVDVSRGEVLEQIVPGTHHRVQTPSAVASAVGTDFDVHVIGMRTVIVVVEGAVQVQNPQGTVVVTTGQQTSTQPDEPPAPPEPADPATSTTWTDSIPAAPVPTGENAALQANGGAVFAYSSMRHAPGTDYWDPRYINDGTFEYGWQSAAGAVANQWVKLQLGGDPNLPVAAVVIDPSATHGQDPSNALKDFEIRVSSTGPDDASFHTVLQDTIDPSAGLQRFDLPDPTPALYLELYAKNNQGGADGIAVAELEVVRLAPDPTPAPVEDACSTADGDACTPTPVDCSDPGACTATPEEEPCTTPDGSPCDTLPVPSEECASTDECTPTPEDVVQDTPTPEDCASSNDCTPTPEEAPADTPTPDESQDTPTPEEASADTPTPEDVTADTPTPEDTPTPDAAAQDTPTTTPVVVVRR